MKNLLIEIYGDSEEGLFFADGLDEALIGICPLSHRLVYSRSKVINILMRKMSELDARDFAEFNIFNSYEGDLTPIFIEDFTDYLL